MIQSPSRPAAMMKLSWSCPSGRRSDSAPSDVSETGSASSGKRAVRIGHAQPRPAGGARPPARWLVPPKSRRGAGAAAGRSAKSGSAGSARRAAGRQRLRRRAPHSPASARTRNTACAPPAARWPPAKMRARAASRSAARGSYRARNRARTTGAGNAPRSSTGAHSHPPRRNRIRETAARTGYAAGGIRL